MLLRDRARMCSQAIRLRDLGALPLLHRKNGGGELGCPPRADPGLGRPACRAGDRSHTHPGRKYEAPKTGF